MRETPLSNCERDFILKAITEKRRLDGRQPYDFRHLKILFGVDRGCCEVCIGNTRVLAQVSSEVTQPKQNRPKDGILFINVELSPMASPAFEPGKATDYAVEINRLMERCLKESRCLDTESLCIVAGEKVWKIRVDVIIMNCDGNIIDGASIAAVGAMSHYRRPDVTVVGEEVTIHPVDERPAVPLTIHHMPICVSFAFFEKGKFLLIDPVEKEEKVMEGRMVIGMNKHREICTLQLTGDMLIMKDQVLRCSNIAVVKVTEITELIHRALENDNKLRAKGLKCGSAESAAPENVMYLQQSDSIEVDTSDVGEKANEIVENGKLTDSETELAITDVRKVAKNTGVIGEGGPSTWGIVDVEMDEEIQEEQQVLTDRTEPLQSRLTSGCLGSDSEEEETMVLHSSIEAGDSSKTKKKKHKTFPQEKKLGKKKKKIKDSTAIK